MAPQGDDATPARTAIEGRIDDLKLRLGKALAERRAIERRQRETASVDHAAKAEFAIARGRDDLARAAVQERIEIERANLDADRDLAAIDAEAAALEAALVSYSGGAWRETLAARLKELDALIVDAAAASRAQE